MPAASVACSVSGAIVSLRLLSDFPLSRRFAQITKQVLRSERSMLELFKRIGWLNMVNPDCPDHFYDF